jgi:DNA-directed RNA polymerase subunit RPC12/RpoP
MNVYVLKTCFKKDLNMHKHRKYRHGPKHFHGWGPFHGGFWWIGLAILFWSGEWWPGILILVGLNMLFGGIFHEGKKDRTQDWQEWSKDWQEPPARPHHEPSPVPAPKPASPPVNQFHRADSLPLTCARCGGPIRSYEVKWRDERSAACPYCGSNLIMK